MEELPQEETRKILGRIWHSYPDLQYPLEALIHGIAALTLEIEELKKENDKLHSMQREMYKGAQKMADIICHLVNIVDPHSEMFKVEKVKTQ